MIAATYHRSLLNKDEQAAYKRIVSTLLQHKGNVFISGSNADQSSIRRIINAINKDHPEMFWVNFWEYSLYMTPLGYGLRFNMLLSKAASNAIKVTVQEKFNNLRDKVEKHGTSRQQRYLLIAREIAATTTYLHSGSAFWDNTAVGPILRHKAVCEGVAKLFLLYCQRFDLPCAVIGGWMKDEPHAWNMVELDAGIRFVDVTGILNNPLLTFMQAKSFFKTAEQLKVLGYVWD